MNAIAESLDEISSINGMYWYTVSTKPRHEDLVETNLRRLGLETFHPKIKQNKTIRRRKRIVVGPLFPGYLFVRFHIDTHYRAVNYVHGARGLVRFGSVPAKVEAELIESIKSRLEDGCVVVQPPAFSPGQVVRIQEGPLEGLEAVFERELSDHQRAVLLLQTLSYQARVVVDMENVVKC